MKIRIMPCLLFPLLLGGCIPDHWPQKWVAMSREGTEDPAPPMPQWCYKTISAADCYEAPQPGMEDRLISAPPPRMLPQPEAQESLDAPETPPTPLHGN